MPVNFSPFCRCSYQATVQCFLLLKAILPKTTRMETYQFDVQQRTGARLIGGSTYYA